MKYWYQIAYKKLFKQREFQASSSFTLDSSLWTNIWKLDVPHKVRHFWWRACSNNLATNENLVQRKCGNSKACPVCGDYDETVEHLLFDCQWVRAVWFGCNVQLNMGHGSLVSVAGWTSQVIGKENELIHFLSKVVTIAWLVWKTRNEFIFSSNPINPKKTVKRAVEAIRKKLRVKGPKVGPSRKPLLWGHSFPLEDSRSRKLNLNCETSISKVGNDAVYAVVQRNWKGEIINDLASPVKAASPLHGELLAIRFACGMMEPLGDIKAVIESNSQVAIKLSVSELVLP